MQWQVRIVLRPAELHFFPSTREQRHFQNICGSGGAKGWHPLARWMILALTERSFPAHLHSSLLVEEAGQGICNTNTVPLHVREESSPSLNQFKRVIQLLLVCTHMYMWGSKGSQCDLLSTLFQFIPLFIQVCREQLTCLAQRVIVCDSPCLKY